VIEGDISKCFDSIDHNKLISILEERIKDYRFIDLIRKALKAGYMESTTYHHSLIGTPQGSIISPILCNIFMDKFDKFVEELMNTFKRGNTPRWNPEYVKLQTLKRNAQTVSEKVEIHKEMILLPSRLIADTNYRRLSFIRYADD
jgi:retron-type reverse transcriptase